MSRVSRRTFLTGGAGLAGLGVGAAAVGIGQAATSSDVADPLAATLPFYGPHQSGIATPMQANAHFIGLNLVDPNDVDAFRGVLRMWTQDAANLTQGKPGFSDTEPELATSPARLSVTVGLGPGAFAAPGLKARRPSWLAPLPAFAIDKFDDRWGQTDIVLVVASDDAMSLSHAVRVLIAPVRSRARVRWVQQGFHNGRNLFGQVDGTEQPVAENYDRLLWDDGADQAWMAGGTSLVLRRIAMNMDTWEALDRHGRELSTGRTLDTGAPLTGTKATDQPVFTAMRGGIPVIPESAHIARARRRAEHEQILRRPYSYDVPPTGEFNDTSTSGQIFAAYQRNPITQFLPIQQRLAEHDALNEWTVPIGSAVYAMLPGVEPNGYLGSSLFAQ